MKGILIFFKSPLFGFHGNCGKVCPTDSHFFGLSRSTRCGCCSYQVSSISVWRVIMGAVLGGGVGKIQNGGRCHANQGAKNVKFTPNSGSF
jgi:hypothetical protein